MKRSIYAPKSAAFPEYDSFDALGLAHLVRTRQVSAAALLEEVHRRLEIVNAQINAVATNLVAEATIQARAWKPSTGVFQGVPLPLKDIGAALSGVRQTNGSRLLANYVPQADSEFVRRLKGQGFLFFATSTTPEFGVAYTTESSLFGKTRNPWDLSRSTGGSSGGAAALVSSGVVPMAHANDGGGSIRVPASCCGLFGLKPTRGRVPVGPMVGEYWSGMGIEHAISRTVRDSAAMLDVLAGDETGAPYCAPALEGSCLAALERPPGRLRIGFTTSFGGPAPHPDCVDAVASAANLLADLGHEVEEIDYRFDVERLNWALYVIISANLKGLLTLILSDDEKAHQHENLEFWSNALMAWGEQYGAHDYANALTFMHRLGREFARNFEKIDILLSPTLAQPPPQIGTLFFTEKNGGYESMRDINTWFSPFTTIYNMSGHPAASIPLHWTDDNIPIGVQCGAAFGREDLLFSLAAQIEASAPWFHRRPENTIGQA